MHSLVNIHTYVIHTRIRARMHSIMQNNAKSYITMCAGCSICKCVIFMHVHMCIYVMSTTTGNTGSYLTDTGSVYITSDGGLTWNEVYTYVHYLIWTPYKIMFLLTKDIKS